jgi:hypothetical protein
MWTTFARFERDHDVAARVRPPVELRADALAPGCSRPRVGKGLVRIELFGGRRADAGRIVHVFGGLRLSDDLLRHALEHDVAVSVVRVVVRIDQELDRLVLRSLAQPVETDLRGVAILAVDDDDGLGIDQVTNGAAAHREAPDVATDRRENRGWRRRRLRGRLPLPRAGPRRTGDRPGEGGCGGCGKKVPTGHGHDGSV